jgi:hypothetical protein
MKEAFKEEQEEQEEERETGISLQLNRLLR